MPEREQIRRFAVEKVDDAGGAGGLQFGAEPDLDGDRPFPEEPLPLFLIDDGAGDDALSVEADAVPVGQPYNLVFREEVE